MKKSNTLDRIRNGDPVRICTLGHFIPAFVKYASHFGFDCIWLDLEHRAMDQREVQALMAFFHKYDIDCMLRPSTLEKSRLCRYLEDGASGLMIPHVSTPEKAKALVDEAPSAIKEGATKDEAEDLKKQLEEAGGSVDLK